MKTFMSLLILTFLVSPIVSLADAVQDSAKFKAVADAIITKHKVHSGETIKALINKGSDDGDDIFAIQYVDSSGKCSQEGATVSSEAGKINVMFYRFPRQACE